MDLAFAGWLVLLGGLTLLALVATFLVGARMSRSYDRKRRERESEMPRRVCSTCRSDMDYSGIRSLGAGEETLEVECYTCPTCRKVEFFLPPAAVAG